MAGSLSPISALSTAGTRVGLPPSPQQSAHESSTEFRDATSSVHLTIHTGQYLQLMRSTLANSTLATILSSFVDLLLRKEDKLIVPVTPAA